MHKSHLGILLKCRFKSRTWAFAFIISSQVKPELLVHSLSYWASLPFWVSLANGPCPAHHSEGTWDWSKNYLWAAGFGWGLNFSVWKEKPNCHRENARSTYKPTGKHILKTRSVKSTYVEKLWKGKKNWEAKRVSGLVKKVFQVPMDFGHHVPITSDGCCSNWDSHSNTQDRLELLHPAYTS